MDRLQAVIGRLVRHPLAHSLPHATE